MTLVRHERAFLASHFLLLPFYRSLYQNGATSCSTHRTKRKFLPSKIPFSTITATIHDLRSINLTHGCPDTHARQTRKIRREDQKSERTVVPRIPVDYAGFVSAHDRNFASISHEYPRVSLVTKQIRSPRSPLGNRREGEGGEKKYLLASWWQPKVLRVTRVAR